MSRIGGKSPTFFPLHVVQRNNFMRKANKYLMYLLFYVYIGDQIGIQVS